MHPGFLASWCREELGGEAVEVLFTSGYLSQVLGLRLDDGRRVVVKVRPWADRLGACGAVHGRLFAAGYPCPQPLTEVRRVGGWAVSAENLVAPQSAMPAAGPEAAPSLFAAGLADLVRLAAGFDGVGSLAPAPPWADWDGDGRTELWPGPDDRAGDLNQTAPTWLDRVARDVRERLCRRRTGPEVIGHLDWYSGNLGWSGDRLSVVFDWDSIARQPEFSVAGLAAAVWSAGSDPDSLPDPEQTDAFLAGYAVARGREWTAAELELAWLAGLWIRCFDAKKAEVSGQNTDAFFTESEAADRLARAGVARGAG